ncbi:MAG: DUF58 domain-containing protein [Tetrasphaera sp.]
MRHVTESLTLRGRCFLAAGAALVVCGLVLGFRDITRLGVLVGGLPLIVGLIGVRRGLALTTEREVIPSRVRIDETSDVTLVVTNAGSSATPILMAEEQLDYALGDRPRFVVPRLGPGERQLLPYRVRCNVRGRHRLGPLGLRVTDPFDLTVRLAVVADMGELIVLPRVLDLTGGGTSGGLGTEGTIPHMVALHGEDDVSVREYRDGDDLRRIHWPATARTGDLMVRQEDRPAKRRAVVLLDDREVTSSGPRTAGSFEWAVTAVASICAMLIDAGLSTHLIHGGGCLEAATEEPLDLDDLLESLALAEPGPSDAFSQGLSIAADRVGDGALVVAVTGPLAESDALTLSRLRLGGSAAICLVMDLGGSGSKDAAAAAAELRTQGWASAVVENGRSVPEAWAQTTSDLVQARR